MDNALVFVALIVVVIVLAMFLPRWIRRSTTRAGDRASRSVAASRRETILDELGTTLVVEAEESVVREVVDLIALEQPRRFTVMGDGGYGIRFVEADDAVARLAPEGSGTRLQIARSREYLGMPMASEFWGDLRSRVASAARRQGLESRDGAHLLFVRREGEPPTWAPAGD